MFLNQGLGLVCFRISCRPIKGSLPLGAAGGCWPCPGQGPASVLALAAPTGREPGQWCWISFGLQPPGRKNLGFSKFESFKLLNLQIPCIGIAPSHS